MKSTSPDPSGHHRSLRRRWSEWWSAPAWRRRWAWFVSLFEKKPRTIAPPEPSPTKFESFVVPAPTLKPFSTPAKGDGFTFEIQANVVWIANVGDDSDRRVRLSRERVEKAVEERRATIRQELMTAVRPIARTYAPFQAAELEEHLFRVIPDLLRVRMGVPKPTNADSSEGRVDGYRTRGIHVPTSDGYRMEVFLWVNSSPEIRSLQQQIWTSVTIAAGEGTLQHQRLREREALQRAWKDVLTTLLNSMGVRDSNQARWTELLALQLAQSNEPEQTAQVIVEQIMERHGQATRLHSELSEYLWAANGSDGRVRTMDFALGSDAALTRILDSLGVPDLAETRADGLAEEGTDP